VLSRAGCSKLIEGSSSKEASDPEIEANALHS